MKKIIIVAGFISALLGCTRPQPTTAQVGAYYSVDDGEGWFRIAKVLATDDTGVHIRLYKNRWKERPTSLRKDDLSLGSVRDADGFGMGHIPLTRSAFLAWEPVLLETGTVESTELDGYEEWKSSKGGYFGNQQK